MMIKEALTIIWLTKSFSAILLEINFPKEYPHLKQTGRSLLFSKVYHDLGIKIEGIQRAFPDARSKRFNGGGLIVEKIESKDESSLFFTRGHGPEQIHHHCLPEARPGRTILWKLSSRNPY